MTDVLILLGTILGYLAVGVATEVIFDHTSDGFLEDDGPLTRGMCVVMWPIVWIVGLIWGLGVVLQRINRRKT